jgi:hypothetical protein
MAHWLFYAHAQAILAAPATIYRQQHQRTNLGFVINLATPVAKLTTVFSF